MSAGGSCLFCAATVAAGHGAATADPGELRFVAGTVVAGRYRIVERGGRGGMGEVCRAEDTKLGQTVVLKFLRRVLQSRPAALEHLLDEVRIARQISHPNVCRVFDVRETKGLHFLSMEHVDG